MGILDRFRNSVAAFVHDLLMIPIAWLGAYWLRFNLEPVPFAFFRSALEILPLVILVQGGSLLALRSVQGNLAFRVHAGSPADNESSRLGDGGDCDRHLFRHAHGGHPRSVLPIYALLLLSLVGGPRFVYRWMKDHKLYTTGGKKALIVGAGRAGEMLVRDLLRDPSREYEPVAFVDDDPRRRGQEIHGVRVLGGTNEIPNLVDGVDVVLIALPSARSRDMRRIVGICEGTGVPFRTLPKLHDLVSGRATIRALRDVRIEDLLGREPVTLDWTSIRQNIKGKCILVTGGGGSIGSELCRQIARLEPAKLVIFEQSEFNLYAIELELRRANRNLSLAPVLGDVSDEVLVEDTMRKYAPGVVFHAAAYKHVPMLEDQVRAAVKNNVLGTRVMARGAARTGCDLFVLISSDKAVNPGNVMGMTKHIAEVYCQSLSRESKTKFVTVRFGNVLGSAGSVIPLFRKQIAEGGPVTVTDPNMTRYFMTIPESAQLILQASSVGQGGEIFVLDMGEPINIKYLAEQLIRLTGKKPGEDIEIVYTGLRPGEKMHEELFQNDEELIKTPHPKLMLARSRDMDLSLIDRVIDDLARACSASDPEQLKNLLDRFNRLSVTREWQDDQRRAASD